MARVGSSQPDPTRFDPTRVFLFLTREQPWVLLVGDRSIYRGIKAFFDPNVLLLVWWGDQ